MSDKVQVGLRVDREVYEQFKQHVEERNGRWQGMGGNQLENAMRHYIHFGSEKPLPDQVAEMNARLERIEGAVGAAESDGGADTFEPQENTHTPSEKPAAQAATEKKMAYLAAIITDDLDETFDEVPKAKLRDTVKDEYNFRRDTAKRYVDDLKEHFGLVQHPTVDNLLATTERREELIAKHTDAELDDL